MNYNDSDEFAYEIYKATCENPGLLVTDIINRAVDLTYGKLEILTNEQILMALKKYNELRRKDSERVCS